MENYMSLKAIRQKVITCKNCDLCKTRKNSVPGTGNQNADIVFVGEAPGKSEDLHGKPFVGSAGKKLDEALEYSGLTRNQVYITNIVKCRPPKNRIPNDEEKIMCANYLEDELSIINPKIICLMGNTAYGSILNGKCVSKNHGKIIDKNKRMYFISYHPAATIYNPKLGKIFKNDIKKLVKIIQKSKRNN